MHYYYITGTSSGLGKALAETLLQETACVVIGIARHQTIEHKNYIHFTTDLATFENTEAFQFGHHDTATKIVLINNAGTTGEMKYTGALQDDGIAATYQLNVITPHILVNKFIKEYSGRSIPKIIVNVTSGAASSVYDGWSVYCATKAAMDMMSLCVAKECALKNNGFRIFSIAPNVMNTPMQDDIRQADEQSFSRKNKFVDLHTGQHLYDPYVVAKKYIDMIRDADTLTETIYRIE